MVLLVIGLAAVVAAAWLAYGERSVASFLIFLAGGIVLWFLAFLLLAGLMDQAAKGPGAQTNAGDETAAQPPSGDAGKQQEQKSVAKAASVACPASSASYGYVSGDTIFRLSREIFPPSASLAKTIRDIYGDNAVLADWNDLKAALVNENDVKKFIHDTGIQLQTSNYDCDNILLGRGGQETYQGLHYHLARHDGKIPANWSVLDALGANDIHLGRWNHSGQALLKISKAD
jgi:hypothetical protein